MVYLQIDAEQTAERAIASQLERFGCRVLQQAAGGLRVAFPYAETEGEAIVEARLYLGPRNSSVRSARAA
jgi:hypothetical protein